MKKKILAVFLGISMVFGCTGCGDHDTTQMKEFLERINAIRPTESTEFTESTQSTAYKEVADLLEEVQLPKTAAPVSVGDSFPGESNNRYYGAHVIQAMRERESNPIALFQQLVNKGLYQKEEQTDGFTVEVFCDSKQEADDAFQRILSVQPWEERKETDPDLWLREMLLMTAFHPMGSGLSMDLLKAYDQNPVFHYSDAPEDNCYYQYSLRSDGLCGGDVIAIYMPQTETGDPNFQDIQIQFLSLYFRPSSTAGWSVALEMERRGWQTQTAAMICAVEKLMTGTSFICQEAAYDGFHREEYARYQLPGHYELEDYQIEIDTTEYFCPNSEENDSNYEIVRLVNYRIHK